MSTADDPSILPDALERELTSFETLGTYLLLKIGAERFALESSFTRGVARPRAATPLPGAPAHLLGVFELHGQIAVLIDPAPLLGIVDAAPRSMLVLVMHEDAYAALLVNAVEEVRELPASAWSLTSNTPPDEHRFTRAWLELPEGRVRLLDLPRLLKMAVSPEVR